MIFLMARMVVVIMTEEENYHDDHYDNFRKICENGGVQEKEIRRMKVNNYIFTCNNRFQFR